MNLFKNFGKRNEEPVPLETKTDSEKGFSSEESVVMPVDEDSIRKANKVFMEYKSAKTALEKRLRAHEEFWKMRQWKSGVSNARLNGENSGYRIYSTPWLHMCLEGRIADAMDSYPTCNFLPRQQDDEEEATNLSKIVPVVLDNADFEREYNDAVRYCLCHGAYITGNFWDPKARGGLGAISIKSVDAMNLFWEPGIKNLQDSSNLFFTTLMDKDAVERMYPKTKGKLKTNHGSNTKYLYDENIDTSNKCLVVDWYYKKSNGTKNVLHYCKYIGEIILYSSENEGLEEGYYHHGEYPFTMEPLYPVEGSPFGYGLIDTAESTQNQIDILNKAIIDNAAEGSRPRYLKSDDSTINEDELNDPTKRIVHCEGRLDEEHLRPISTSDLPGNYISYLNNLVDQIKYCTANQDVNNGVAPSGVTAASALAALQETSGKNPRQANRVFHRGFKHTVYQIIGLMRQFFVVPQQFRVPKEDGTMEYISYTNKNLVPQPQNFAGQENGFRVPEFDIEVTIEKANPYKKMEHNELILQLNNLGVFAPQNVDNALAILNHMDFDGKEKVIETVQKNASMMDLLLQYQQIALSLAHQVDPALEDRIAQTIIQADQGISSGMVPKLEPSSFGNAAGKEHPFVERSRAQARASTEAD